MLELVYTAIDLAPFARDLGYDGPPFRWDPDRRAVIRAELDAAMFRLYGIERDDVDYILDTFPIVRRRDEQRFGEYRTKRLILERYDAMVAADAAGVEYATSARPAARSETTRGPGMRDAQKPSSLDLTKLLNRLKDGRFVIPDFQRDFEWEPWDIAQLVRSIFLDYYIGSLLLWKGKSENFDALACEAIYGYSGNGETPEHIVLDGQQRLTAMYYAFVAPDVPAPNRTNRFLYFIRVDQFVAGDYDAAFEYDWSRKARKLVESRQLQYDAHRFPLAVIGTGGWELGNWVQGYEAHWRAKAEAAEQEGDADTAAAARQSAADAKTFGEHLRGITEEYQIAYIELDRDLELDKVCDIFTQINSRGIRLDVFDLMNALLKPKGLQLKHLWRATESRLSFVDTQRMNVYVLQVMSILAQAYCSSKYLYYLLPGSTKTVRDPDGSLHQLVLVPRHRSVQTAVGASGGRARELDQAPPSPAGVRRHRLAVPAVRLNPPGVRCAAA